MTETLAHVVITFADFMERRDRRRRIAAELRQQDARRTIDAEVMAVAVARPLSSEQKYWYEGPCRVKNAERAT